MAGRWTLVLSSVAMIAAMFAVVPWLTQTMGPARGYLTVFCLYWFCFCLPLGLAFQRGSIFKRLSLEVGEARWVPMAVLMQVFIICAVSWYHLPNSTTWLAVGLAIVFGTTNGFLEEFFWRGAFLEQGAELPWFQVLGVALFSLWHVPLTLAHGITNFGGPLMLVGSAVGLGVFWSVIAWKTNRIGWTVISHIATNVAAFVGLISMNMYK